MSGKLLECGLLTEIDGAALALYCQAWARWIDAEKNMAEYGTVVKGPTGALVPSPFLAIANKAMDQMMKMLVEFGMSPSSRMRVTVAVRRQDAQRPRPHDESASDPRLLLRMVERRP